MAQVFVSHSTEDVAIALQVVATLKAGGVNVWIAPDSIPPGVAYNEAIVAGLPASDTLAVLVSKAANASKHVAREVALADDHGKRILPIRIEPIEPSDGLAYYLNLPQWVEWHSHGAAAMAPVIALLRGAPTPPPVRSPPPPAPPAPAYHAPAVDGGMVAIEIHRTQSMGAGLRKMALLIDGQKAGEIGNGETVSFHVPPGRHELIARIDYIKSEVFLIDVSSGDAPVLHVSAANATDVGGQLAGILGRSGYFKWSRVN
ncbi:MAG: toll/interleukin-1 receptor domain-containing protein [Alphaproteobacteria bacterium]